MVWLILGIIGVLLIADHVRGVREERERRQEERRDHLRLLEELRRHD